MADVRQATIDRHEAVRAMVERAHPNCRVAEISESARTRYHERREPGADGRMRGTGEWFVGRADVDYVVEAVSLVRGEPDVRCTVIPDDMTGELRIADTTLTLGYAG